MRQNIFTVGFMFHNKSVFIKLFFPIVICYAFIGWQGLLDTG